MLIFVVLTSTFYGRNVNLLQYLLTVSNGFLIILFRSKSISKFTYFSCFAGENGTQPAASGTAHVRFVLMLSEKQCTMLFSEVVGGLRDQVLLFSEYDESVFKMRRITHCIPNDVFTGLACYLTGDFIGQSSFG